MYISSNGNFNLKVHVEPFGMWGKYSRKDSDRKVEVESIEDIIKLIKEKFKILAPESTTDLESIRYVTSRLHGTIREWDNNLVLYSLLGRKSCWVLGDVKEKDIKKESKATNTSFNSFTWYNPGEWILEEVHPNIAPQIQDRIDRALGRVMPQNADLLQEPVDRAQLAEAPRRVELRQRRRVRGG